VLLLLTHPQDRLLSIEGQASIVYRADDPEAERRAWAAVATDGRAFDRQTVAEIP